MGSVSSNTLPGGSTQYIQNSPSLQAGASFYVLSGTVTTMNMTTGRVAGSIVWPDGTVQVSSPPVASSASSGIVSPGTFTWTNAFGISVSTLNVQTLSSTGYEAKFSTASAIYHVAISTNGHLLTQGSVPVVSACGSGPNGSAVGNDIAGVVTVGGGISVTSCVLTFVNPYETNPPICFVNDGTNVLFTEATTTAAALTIHATASFGGDNVSYLCVGRQ